MTEDFANISISEMSKEALVDEVLMGQRDHLMREEMASLKALVIDYRTARVRERLEAEAGISTQRTMFGTQIMETGNEDL